MAKTKKKPKEYTQKEIKKYGLCKHHLVGYKQLEKLVKKQQKYIVNQDKILDRLSKDIERKSEMMNLWMTNRQPWTDKINKDLLQKAENHAKEKKEIKEHYEKELAEVNKLYEEAVETNREIVEINRDAIKTNREIIKSHNEITFLIFKPFSISVASILSSGPPANINLKSYFLFNSLIKRIYFEILHFF